MNRASTPLTEALRSWRLAGAIHGRLELSAPWGAHAPRSEAGVFYAVLSGRCVLSVEGGLEHVELGAGDLAMLPHGDAYALRDAPRTRTRPVEELLLLREPPGSQNVLRYGGGGAKTLLAAGLFEVEDREHNPLLAALPRVVHARAAATSIRPSLEQTLEQLWCEAASDRPGREAVVARLAEILLIQILRAHIASLPAGEGGWLRALGDRHTAAAMALVQRDPAYPWTVADLASGVGLSRSAFAARFTEVVGEPPLRFVTRLRMFRAAALLSSGRHNVSEVAYAVGYDSVASFAKTFRAWTGAGPRAYRSRALADRAGAGAASEPSARGVER